MAAKSSKERLSDRQRRILQFIIDYIGNKGYAPSVREIGAGMGLSSTATVYAHLQNLEKKGFIQRDSTKPRTIEVTAVPEGFAPPGPRARSLPILGKVTAGEPLLAVENLEGYLPLAPELTPSQDCFFLRVKGDSMADAGILEGDLVLVIPQAQADNGDIVVALVADDEATVKRFYREDSQVRLQPENPAYEPIFTRQVKLVGKVTAVLRLL